MDITNFMTLFVSVNEFIRTKTHFHNLKQKRRDSEQGLDMKSN